MLDTPQILQTTPQLMAILHLEVSQMEMQEVMGPGLAELHKAVAAQGITVMGPWFTHHLSFAPGRFNFDICLPVSKPVSAVGRVRPGEWPAMKVARTVYRGGFEGVGRGVG